MKAHFTLPILFLFVVSTTFSQVVPRRETDNSRLVLGRDKPDRVLVVRKMYSPVRFIFQEQRYIWLEYRDGSGAIVSLDGPLSSIKESSIVVGTKELLLQSIVRVEIHRRGRSLLLFAGAAAATGALLGLFSDGSNESLAAYSAAAVALFAAGFSIQKKVPIGDKFRIWTEPY